MRNTQTATVDDVYYAMEAVPFPEERIKLLMPPGLLAFSMSLQGALQVPFATVLLSLVAWGAECVGCLLIFRGLGATASLDASTFIYAFATVAGGAMPGGLGVSDGALASGAAAILGMAEGPAVASALLIRVATLWFGVMLGALALLRFDRLLGGGIRLERPFSGEE